MISDCDDRVHSIFVVFHNMEDAHSLWVPSCLHRTSPHAPWLYSNINLCLIITSRHFHYLKTPPYLGYLLHLPQSPHLRHLPQSLLRRPLPRSLEHMPIFFLTCKNHQYEGMVGKVVVCKNLSCTGYLGHNCIAQHKIEVAMGDKREVLN